ncbi:phosphatidate cytidylyltransferase [Methylovirgula sp. 4M-Z18]|uniref:phosphatidate cytidylyltransferase n=1 Tax=Methylovirgula sp. 4M-Z18 TaxID=2293567 RepID=UPI000E2E6E9A|nr:CDP-archaeol synthase [Methylovirgula sp. 4M-Z18]RFB80217.1 CDP-archaeol synthase [Methylovirgula sp. 4M-Z18]
MSDSQPLPAATKRYSFTDLGPRVVSGLVLIALALGTAWRGGRIFLYFWLVAAVLILWEWLTVIGARQRVLQFVVGLIGLLLAAHFALRRMPDFLFLSVLFAAGTMASLAEPRRRLWAPLGLVYATLAFLPAWVLRNSVLFGPATIYWLFAVVWGTDIMAYFGGRLIGGAKLWPQVSPSKTWAGFLTGISCGTLFGLALLAALTDAPSPIHFLQTIGLGLLTGVVAQGGDLVESSIKRYFGVKDASRLIPGHGGVMDRLDGFIAAALLAVIVGSLRAGVAAPGIGLFR